MKISFYPGPSTVYKEVPQYVAEAYEKGILSINHRSAAFADILKQAISLLKEKLNIPKEYEIVFTSSATECWEIIAQSLLEKESCHFYNGDFGKKWFQYTQRLRRDATGFAFDINEELPYHGFPISETAEIICITQNETSNGTQVSNEKIAELRKSFPNKLIAIDATSSMAGIYLDISQADIWYASVQKCFGLPAGLGIMICSPAAVEKAFALNEYRHYNSLIFMLENIRNFQTHYTPNVLNIFLLMKVLASVGDIRTTEKALNSRYDKIEREIKEKPFIHFLCSNQAVRSKTILAIAGLPEIISAIKKEAENNDILLGNGYGTFKSNSFRIANFPAISDLEIHILIDFLAHKLPDFSKK